MSSWLWQYSHMGASLARATVMSKLQVCTSWQRKSAYRAPKPNATMMNHQRKWPDAMSEDSPCQQRTPVPLLTPPDTPSTSNMGGGGFLASTKASASPDAKLTIQSVLHQQQCQPVSRKVQAKKNKKNQGNGFHLPWLITLLNSLIPGRSTVGICMSHFSLLIFSVFASKKAFGDITFLPWSICEQADPSKKLLWLPPVQRQKNGSDDQWGRFAQCGNWFRKSRRQESSKFGPAEAQWAAVSRQISLFKQRRQGERVPKRIKNGVTHQEPEFDKGARSQQATETRNMAATRGNRGRALAATVEPGWPALAKTSHKQSPQGLGALSETPYEEMGQCKSATQIPGGNRGGESKNWQKLMALAVAAGPHKCRERCLKLHMMKRANAEALP